jgi:hypothetical protein
MVAAIISHCAPAAGLRCDDGVASPQLLRQVAAGLLLGLESASVAKSHIPKGLRGALIRRLAAMGRPGSEGDVPAKPDHHATRPR